MIARCFLCGQEGEQRINLQETFQNGKFPLIKKTTKNIYHVSTEGTKHDCFTNDPKQKIFFVFDCFQLLSTLWSRFSFSVPALAQKCRLRYTCIGSGSIFELIILNFHFRLRLFLTSCILEFSVEHTWGGDGKYWEFNGTSFITCVYLSLATIHPLPHCL